MNKLDKGNYFHCDHHPVDQQVTGSKYVKEVKEVWMCNWRYRGKLRFMMVVVTYLYDGGSIPRIGWSVLGVTPSGPGDSGFLPHDVLYRSKGGKKPEALKGCTIVNENGNNVIVPRPEADWVMYAGMRWGGIIKRRARIAHTIVRAAGAHHWGGPMPSLNKKSG